MSTHPHFVPNGESRQETAVLLVGTASEFGIDQRSIRAVSGGFYITDDLAATLVAESDPEPDPEPVKAPEPTKRAPTKKTSGNRAAKNATDKE